MRSPATVTSGSVPYLVCVCLLSYTDLGVCLLSYTDLGVIGIETIAGPTGYIGLPTWCVGV